MKVSPEILLICITLLVSVYGGLWLGAKGIGMPKHPEPDDNSENPESETRQPN